MSKWLQVPTEPKPVDLLEVERFAEIQARKRIEEELDIANEIFLAKNWNTVHYADLINKVPPGTASKNMLIAQLNDTKRRDRLVRPGLVTMYRKERAAHFSGGVWSARYLCQYVEYLAKKLTDKMYVGSAEKAYLFRNSFCNEDWLFKAIAVCGLKLLEDCYMRNALKSDVARGYLSITFKERQRLEDTAQIIGRCTKNHEVTREFSRELREIAEKSLKHALKIQLEISLNHREHGIFDWWKPHIEATLHLIPDKIAAFFAGEPDTAGGELIIVDLSRR
ncbi:MAG TPA: hypothetical protein PK728_01745 [Bacillota bacterium]|nr:hypothetical protein [Bacillota bacterium]